MNARLQIGLTVAGPVLSAGTQPARFGIDASFLRDADGGLILAGAQLRGVVRQMLHAMSAAAPSLLPPDRVDDWFGSESGARGTNEGEQAAWTPNYGRLHFSDLRLTQEASTPATLTRTRVDVHTGAVAAGALQVIEAPLGLGEQGQFVGTVDIEPTADPWAVREWLGKALALVPAIGAHKTAGFGRIVAFCISEPVPETTAGCACRIEDVEAIAGRGEAMLVLAPSAPFLVNAERWGGNLFRGSATIPGSVVKAVFGRSLQPDHPLQSALSAAVFRECRPARPGAARPRTSPLSRYAAWSPDGDGKDCDFLDAFDDDAEELADGFEIAFRPDWKGDVASRDDHAFGHTFVPTYDVRTRTAVNERGVAADGKLFTTAAVKPDGEHLWVGSIARGSLDQAAFGALVAAFPSHLERIGKTRTSATATLALPTVRPPSVRSVRDDRVRFVLETDAVLHGPQDLYLFPEEQDPERRLRRQYAAYFVEALAERGGTRPDPEALELRFYARQKRVGGYLAYRYPPSSEGYSPWIVTAAGSAFEMQLAPSLHEAFASFLKRGLPPPASLDLARRLWTGNPFVPENGYGEIRLLPDAGDNP